MSHFFCILSADCKYPPLMYLFASYHPSSQRLKAHKTISPLSSVYTCFSTLLLIISASATRAKCASFANTTMTAGIGPRARLFTAKASSTVLAVLEPVRHISAQSMEAAQRAIIQPLHLPSVGWNAQRICMPLSNNKAAS